jgi:hypothetical protein
MRRVKHVDASVEFAKLSDKMFAGRKVIVNNLCKPGGPTEELRKDLLVAQAIFKLHDRVREAEREQQLARAQAERAVEWNEENRPIYISAEKRYLGTDLPPGLFGPRQKIKVRGKSAAKTARRRAGKR